MKMHLPQMDVKKFMANLSLAPVSNWLGRFVEIRPQERLKTWIMFFYFFSIIATIWMLKPVRNALFLDELGAKNLRYVYMGEGLFLIGVVWVFAQCSKRASKRALYNGVLISCIFCLVVFWFLFRMKISYLSALFYVWSASYSIIMTTQFFTLANDIFDPLEAKRLFGFILSGGSIGGVLGGILTNRLVGAIGTENLLLVIAGVIGLCSFLVMRGWKHLVPHKAPSSQAIPAGGKKSSSKEAAGVSGGKLLMGSSYLMILAALVIMAKMTSAIVDNQFNATIELSIAGKDARTAFYGSFFSFLNALSFVMQLFVTSIVFRYLGVGIAIWILPAGLLVGSLGTAVYPALMAGIFLKAFEGSINYSVQQASREVLYLPVASAVRYKVKPVIDMLGFRISKSLAGVYIALAAPLLGIPDQRLSVLILCLLPFWFLLVWHMKRGYSKMLRSNLLSYREEGRPAEFLRATDVLSCLYNEKTMDSIQSFLSHRSTYTRKLASSAYVLYMMAEKDFDSMRQAIDHIVRREALGAEKNSSAGLAAHANGQILQELENLLFHQAKQDLKGDESLKNPAQDYPEDALIKLGEILRGPEKELDVKRRAVRLLELIPKQEVADMLLSGLRGSSDNALRYIMLKALNRLHDRNEHLQMNRFLVKEEIAREVEIHEKLRQLRAFYEYRMEAEAPGDYLGVTLKAIQDESFERVFRLMDLLYPHEMIQIIHDRLIEHPAEDPLRAHAVELLNNTAEPDLLILVRRILEERQPKELPEKEGVKILEEFIASQDQWFYLTGVFLASELGLDKRWPQLAGLVKKFEQQYF